MNRNYIERCIAGEIGLHGTDTQSKRNLSKLRRLCYRGFQDGDIKSYTIASRLRTDKPRTYRNGETEYYRYEPTQLNIVFFTPYVKEQREHRTTVDMPECEAQRIPAEVAKQLLHDTIIAGVHTTTHYKAQMASWVNYK
jgi:hypothetical protein